MTASVQPPTQGAIISKAVQAAGGADRLASVKTVSAKGTMKQWEPEQSAQAGGEMRFANEELVVRVRRHRCVYAGVHRPLKVLRRPFRDNDRRHAGHSGLTLMQRATASVPVLEQVLDVQLLGRSHGPAGQAQADQRAAGHDAGGL